MSSNIKKHHSADVIEKSYAQEEIPESNKRSIETTRRVNTACAAKLLGISESTLRKWRMRGSGPRFVKVGSRVLYDTGELEDWLETRSRTKTSGDPMRRSGSKDEGLSALSECAVNVAGGGAHG